MLAWLIVPAVRQTPSIPEEVEAPDEPPPLTNIDIVRAVENVEPVRGRVVDFEGRIAADPVYDSQGTHLQVTIDSELGPVDVIVRYEVGFMITEGDYVRVQGDVTDWFSGKMDDGEPIETLEITAVSIDTTDPANVLAPALEVWQTGVEKQAAKIKVSISRVEFAATETRFNIAILNDSKKAIVVQVFNSFIKQGNRLIEPLPELPVGYKEMPVDLAPGASGGGVLLFPALDSAKSLKLGLTMQNVDGEITLDFSLKPD